MTSEPHFSDYKEEARFIYDRANSYEESSELEKALDECDIAILIDWELADAYNLRGIILEGLGRLREAVKAYAKAIKIDPEFEEARENLHILDSKLNESHHLVDIATFNSSEEAYLQKSRLESEGIRAFVTTTSWLGSIAQGGVKLQVEVPNVQPAVDILNEVAGILPHARAAPPNSEFYCENCDHAMKEKWKICAHCGDAIEEIDTDESSSDYVCPYCDAPCADKWEVCPACGAQLIEVIGYSCSKCGIDVEDNWNNCPNCGESLEEIE